MSAPARDTSRRPAGAPPQNERATRFAGVVVEVPEPAATAAFLSEGIGFCVAEDEGGVWHVSCVGEYRSAPALSVLSLRPGPSLALVGMKFDVDESYDLDELRSRLGAAGAGPEPRRRGCGSPDAHEARSPGVESVRSPAPSHRRGLRRVRAA
jgi:hypothetical protein